MEPMDTITEASGAEICVCSKHKLEYCHLCPFDFRDMNEEARRDAACRSDDACSNPACPAAPADYAQHPALKTCSGCGRARYCSRKCQKAHWRVHKTECNRGSGRDGAGSGPGQGRRGNFVPRQLPCQFGRGTLEELAPGTRLRLPDRSGRQPPSDLHGTIVSTNLNGKDDITGYKLPTYRIRYQDGAYEEVPCEDVHDEWEITREAAVNRPARSSRH